MRLLLALLLLTVFALPAPAVQRGRPVLFGRLRDAVRHPRATAGHSPARNCGCAVTGVCPCGPACACR